MSPETEPGPWELMRMLREINGKLDKLVSREAFEAEVRRVDDRFAAQGQDIVEERVAREKAVAEIVGRLDKTSNNVKWLAAAILLPIALFVAGILTSKGS